MIKTVFLDLDDTLLRTNTDKFIEQYLMGLLDFMPQYEPTLAQANVALDKALRRSLGAAMQDKNPTLSNSAVFSDAFQRMVEMPPDASRTMFDAYHERDYPQLISMTSRIDNAASLIRRLGEMGIGVVIATNPLFTLKAITQRLAWAGLDDPSIRFAFVSNIDDLHFTKPHPEFYEELIARTGVEADETLMVGDSLTDDMIPAARAGLNTFWIRWDANLPDDVPDELKPNGSGTLAEFEQMVSDGWLATLTARPRTSTQVIPRLLGNAGALFGLVDLIKPDYWDMRPDPNEWSPLEILCHLRDSERNVQRPRLERIAYEENPFISQPKAPPGPRERDLSHEDGIAVLQEFWAERCKTLEFLVSLSSDAWERSARHSIFGPTTLLEMAHFTARHDHLHINQLCQTVGRCQQALR